MAKKNAAYWKDRFVDLETASNAYGHEAFMQIEPSFDSALRQIQSEIDSWYGRFAKNNQITMQEARKLLSSSELKEFRWDVKEYIKYGHENDINPIWMKELENASAKFHISRLEALKVRTQQAAEVAFGNELDVVDAMARKVFTENYYHSIFEMQKSFNVGWEIGQVDERKLEKLISRPWAADGKNFSERIWESRTQLVSEVHNQLTRTCILGKAPDDAIKHISKKFQVSKNQAGRLVMTEQAYFHSVSQKEAFNDLDVEEFEIVATLDSLTSEICQEMDGKHFPMKDYEAGVTAPPFHPWCRSVTVPYFEDNFTGERAARGEDGKTYYVPDSMTYPEWKKSMVDGETADLQSVSKSDTMKVKKEISEPAKEIIESLTVNKVESNPVSKLEKKLSTTEIIERLAGGDMTKGSCSSLAFAYTGNKNGLDVLDFRGGNSQYVFSCNSIIQKVVKLPGINGSITKVKKEIQGTMEILKNLELNKEYYLAVGRHAAIVRRLETGVEYLELQSSVENGWTSFDKYGSMFNTLWKRFGCRKTVDRSYGQVWEKSVVLMDVDSFHDNYDFEQLLAYINTQGDKQKKGVGGSVK